MIGYPAWGADPYPDTDVFGLAPPPALGMGALDWLLGPGFGGSLDNMPDPCFLTPADRQAIDALHSGNNDGPSIRPGWYVPLPDDPAPFVIE